jgi:hypothetical protein
MLQVLPVAEMSPVLPTTQIIARSFNIADKGLLPWTLAAYGLTFGKFMVSGRLGDIFGHKNRIIIGFGWMALWSMAFGLPWIDVRCTARSAGVMAMDVLRGLYSVRLPGTPCKFRLATPPSPPMRISPKEKLQDADWLGAFSGTVALVYINIAWNCAIAQGCKT